MLAPDRLLQCRILSGIRFAQRSTNHGRRAPAVFDSACESSGVDASCKTGHDRNASLHQLAGQPARTRDTVARCFACPHDRNAPLRKQANIARKEELDIFASPAPGIRSEQFKLAGSKRIASCRM